MLRFFIDRSIDTQTSKPSAEEASVELAITRRISLRAGFRWKSAMDGRSPYYHAYAYLSGTRLGQRPLANGWWLIYTRRFDVGVLGCIANGTNLFNASFNPTGDHTLA